MLRKIAVLLLPLLLVAFMAFAQTNDQSKELKELDKQSAQLTSESNQEIVFNSLSEQLGISVEDLRAQQKSTTFSPGQLFIANALAAAIEDEDVDFESIASEFKSGKGWGVIAKENSVKLGKIISDLKRANKQVEEKKTEQTKVNTRNQNQARNNSNARNQNQVRSNSNARGNANSGNRGNAGGNNRGSSGSRGRR